MKACPPPSLAPTEYKMEGGLNYSLKMVASIIRTQAPQGQAQLDFHSFCQVQQLLTHVQQVFGQYDVIRTAR
ncbi:hypothetical protein AB1Y20_013693 [Prymnesium parvum]